MNEPDDPIKDDSQPESLTGETDKLADTGTTMRLKTLQLEGELWPDEDAADPDDDDGVDPYNTGRFDSGKR